MAAGSDNLIPFQKGHDPRRQPGRGRPSKLNDPEFVEAFAQAVAEGIKNDDLSEMFDVSVRTVKNYKRDQRVKVASIKHVEDRILRITRRTDSKIDALVETADFKALPIEDQIGLLLKIRKEYLGGAFRLQAEGGKVEAETINDTLNALEDDPEFAREVAELAERLKKG